MTHSLHKNGGDVLRIMAPPCAFASLALIVSITVAPVSWFSLLVGAATGFFWGFVLPVYRRLTRTIAKAALVFSICLGLIVARTAAELPDRNPGLAADFQFVG